MYISTLGLVLGIWFIWSMAEAEGRRQSKRQREPQYSPGFTAEECAKRDDDGRRGMIAAALSGQWRPHTLALERWPTDQAALAWEAWREFERRRTAATEAEAAKWLQTHPNDSHMLALMAVETTRHNEIQRAARLAPFWADQWVKARLTAAPGAPGPKPQRRHPFAAIAGAVLLLSPPVACMTWARWDGTPFNDLESTAATFAFLLGLFGALYLRRQLRRAVGYEVP